MLFLGPWRAPEGRSEGPHPFFIMPPADAVWAPRGQEASRDLFWDLVRPHMGISGVLFWDNFSLLSSLFSLLSSLFSHLPSFFALLSILFSLPSSLFFLLFSLALFNLLSSLLGTEPFLHHPAPLGTEPLHHSTISSWSCLSSIPRVESSIRCTSSLSLARRNARSD